VHVVLPLLGGRFRDGGVAGRGGRGGGRGGRGRAGRALGVELGGRRVDLARGGDGRRARDAAASRAGVGGGPALDDAGGVEGAVAPPAVDEGADLEREQSVGGLKEVEVFFFFFEKKRNREKEKNECECEWFLFFSRAFALFASLNSPPVSKKSSRRCTRSG